MKLFTVNNDNCILEVNIVLPNHESRDPRILVSVPLNQTEKNQEAIRKGCEIRVFFFFIQSHSSLIVCMWAACYIIHFIFNYPDIPDILFKKAVKTKKNRNERTERNSFKWNYQKILTLTMIFYCFVWFSFNYIYFPYLLQFFRNLGYGYLQLLCLYPTYTHPDDTVGIRLHLVEIEGSWRFCDNGIFLLFSIIVSYN